VLIILIGTEIEDFPTNTTDVRFQVFTLATILALMMEAASTSET
jgi:hypothetical protein